MANPFVAVLLYAETRGFIDLSGYSKRQSWLTGLRLRLRAAKADMQARVREIECARLAAEMSLRGIDAEGAREAAMAAQKRFEATLKPWIRSPVDQPADDLDLVASWYIMYEPERLKKLGVDFGAAKPVS